MGLEVGGLLGLVVLVADVWAIVTTLQSRASTSRKVLWVVLVLLLPCLGLALWFVFGPRAR